MNRGGAREGSGRKCKGKSPRVQLSCLVKPEIKEYIQIRAKEAGLSNSDIVNRIVEYFIDEHKKG